MPGKDGGQETGDRVNQTRDRVVRAMRDRPTPAASVSELLRTLADDGQGPGPDSGALLHALRRCPDRFKVLDPKREPWDAIDLRDPAEYAGPLLEQGVTCEPWIVALDDSALDTEEESSSRDSLSRRTRQSLVWLARAVDEESPAAVNRWCRLLREELRFQAGWRRHVTSSGPPQPPPLRSRPEIRQNQPGKTPPTNPTPDPRRSAESHAPRLTGRIRRTRR